MRILSSSDKKKIIEKLKSQYGIEKMHYLFLQFGKEKIRIYSGNLSREELSKLDRELRVENIGLYLGKLQHGELRLTLDVLQILQPQITKNILKINKQQAQSWLQGKDITLDSEIPREFFVLNYNDNLIGCGKSVGNIIKNYMPKERRIKD